MCSFSSSCPFLLQLPHLGLGDLSDKDIALGLAGAGVPEVVELGGVPLIARGPVHLYPVLLKGRGTAAKKVDSRAERSMDWQYCSRSRGWMVGPM